MEWSILDFSMSALSLDLKVCFNIAAVCSILFLLKIVGIFVGGEGIGHQHDGQFADFDLGGDGNMDSHDAFNVFTIQSALAFGMVFGWSVLSARLEYQMSPMSSYLMGSSLGVLAAILSAYLMKLTNKINSRATKNVVVPVGTEGKVYLKIPGFQKSGGKVTVVVNKQSIIVDAKTKGNEIPSFADIKVVANEPELVVELINK